jgi:hypothetical protein
MNLLGTNRSYLQINFRGGKGTVGAVVVVCLKAWICHVIVGLKATTWFRVALYMTTTWPRDFELRSSQLTCIRKVDYNRLILVTSLKLYWLTDDCSVEGRWWSVAWLMLTMLSAADILWFGLWYVLYTVNNSAKLRNSLTMQGIAISPKLSGEKMAQMELN